MRSGAVTRCHARSSLGGAFACWFLRGYGGAMKYGLFGINFGACVETATAIAVAQAAESAGFDSVWTGEHVVLPDPQVPPSPVPPSMPMLDPVVSLTVLSQH